MKVILALLVKLWKDKKLRLRLILAAILIFLVSIFLFRTTVTLTFPDKPVMGSILTLKCSKCGAVEDRRTMGLEQNDEKCSKCGGQMGYRYKCADCGFEYSYLPRIALEAVKDEKNKYIALERIAKYQLCPNCGSSDAGYSSSAPKQDGK